MISVLQLLLNEGKAARYIGAGLTGLGGIYTGGTLVGGYQGMQKSQYGKQIARKEKDERDEYEHTKKLPLRATVGAVLGSIPGVGAVSNVINQHELEKQKDKIKEGFKKK